MRTLRNRRLRKRAPRIIHRLHAHQVLRSTTRSHRLRSLRAAHRLRRLRDLQATALTTSSCPSIPRLDLQTTHRQLPLHSRHLAQHGVMVRSPRSLQCRQALRLLGLSLKLLPLSRTGITSRDFSPTLVLHSLRSHLALLQLLGATTSRGTSTCHHECVSRCWERTCTPWWSTTASQITQR